ncbi:MAG: hypothetical protein PHX18_00200 [Candidatus Gastranaerophilales bacterium]|nr:hypothetical protein [Candidatus Gastranaerophilales bacterium]
MSKGKKKDMALENLAQENLETDKEEVDLRLDYLRDKIAFMFEELDSARAKQKEDIKSLENAVFLKDNDKFQMPDLFELYQTFKSHIWENLYSNLESLFDVKGLNQQSEQNALIQKRNLMRYFESSRLVSTLDKAIDFLIRKSEAVVFVGWRTEEKFVRREVEKPVAGIDAQTSLKTKKVIEVQPKKVYEGLDIKAIDPENLVFDTENKKYFIYQTFITPEQLDCINDFNLLDEAAKTMLKHLIHEKDRKTSKGVIDDKIELLEYWGDIVLQDGTVLRNQVVVLAAREFIIRLEDNPFVINPFVVMNIVEDPDTKRGFLYLKTALPMKEKAQQIFVNQLRALEFVTNPAYLAPKGAFSSPEQKIDPGKIVEYEPALMPQTPMPLNMTGALQGWEFLTYLKSIEETTTGIFKNFAGLPNSTQRSATEVQFSAGGQNARLAMIIDCINQDLVIPIVEKSADLIANLVFEDENIFVQIDNSKQTLAINQNVRNGEYKYIYGDRNAIQVRKFKAKEMFDACANLFKIFPELKNTVNANEVMKFLLEQYGFDNFERFKVNELPKTADFSPNLPFRSGYENQRMGGF